MTAPGLRTARLRLVPFAPRHLLALVEEPERFRAVFGYAAADGLREFFTSGDVSAEWLAQLRRGGEADPWSFGFALVDDSGEVAGSAGFKGPPDPDGVAEIAYGIVPRARGTGLATEAAAALVAFAREDGRVATLRAPTLPTPSASTRVLEKCGFAFAGEVVDPEDGPVWRWELAATPD